MPYQNVPEELWSKMDDCVTAVQKTGKSKQAAVAICYVSVVQGGGKKKRSRSKQKGEK